MLFLRVGGLGGYFCQFPRRPTQEKKKPSSPSHHFLSSSPQHVRQAQRNRKKIQCTFDNAREQKPAKKKERDREREFETIGVRIDASFL